MNNLDGYGTVEYGIRSLAHAFNKAIGANCGNCPCDSWCRHDGKERCEDVMYEFIGENICGLNFTAGPSESTSDEIRPDWYKITPEIEAWDVINPILNRCDYTGECIGYLKDILKYVLRADQKNGLEDYKKAYTNLKQLIRVLEEGGKE
jgi:hypothetical protein